MANLASPRRCGDGNQDSPGCRGKAAWWNRFLPVGPHGAGARAIERHVPGDRIALRFASSKIVLILILALSWANSLRAEETEPQDNYQIVTHLSAEQALKKIFPEADQVLETRISLDPDQAKRVEERVGHSLAQNNLTIFVGKRQGKILGYALVDEEIGKYRPITSMVGVDTQGKVLGVAIMVYRESRGGEVSHKRFLQQYVGKTNSDPIRVHQDIIAISGATLSVRAVSTQVRKALAVVEEVFLKGNATP